MAESMSGQLSHMKRDINMYSKNLNLNSKYKCYTCGTAAKAENYCSGPHYYSDHHCLVGPVPGTYPDA